MFSLESSVVCMKLEMPVIEKMWEYASIIALIPSCLMSILEVHRDPENEASRSMRAILCGIMIMFIVVAFIARQTLTGGTEDFQKTIVETLSKDNPDFKIAIEKTLKEGIDPKKLNLTKEIQDSFSGLLKDVNDS